MKLANLRNRLTIQQKAGTPDGIGGRLVDWIDVAMVWAEIVPASGNERYRAERLEGTVTHKITIRHRPGITSQLRLVTVTGSPQAIDRVFSIKSVINKDEGKERWLELLCVEGEPA